MKEKASVNISYQDGGINEIFSIGFYLVFDHLGSMDIWAMGIENEGNGGRDPSQ